MNCSRERRRVREVRILKIIQFRVHVNSHHRDIHHLVHFTRSEYLNSEKLSCGAVRNHFRDKEGSVRIVMCLIVCRNKSSDHIISRFFCLILSKTGPSDIQSRKLHHAGSQHARIGFLRPCQDLRQRTSFQVSGGSHG